MFDLEVEILNAVAFRVSVPSPLDFLGRLMRVVPTLQGSRVVYQVAQYFLNLAFLDARICSGLLASRLAAGAL